MKSLFQEANTGIHRDLKLNLQGLLEGPNLDKTTTHLALLALATSTHNQELQERALTELNSLQTPHDQIEEASELAGLMGMLNIYYRFRHMIKVAHTESGEDNYKRTGLRMNSMAKPIMPHLTYEMLSFAISVYNGCEMCITAHEKKSLELGANTEQLHDLARMAAVVKAATDFAYSRSNSSNN